MFYYMSVKKCQILSRGATSRFNLLTHAFSILNRNIPNQNSMHNLAFLPWSSKNLGLAHLALYAENGMLQRAFKGEGDV